MFKNVLKAALTFTVGAAASYVFFTQSEISDLKERVHDLETRPPHPPVPPRTEKDPEEKKEPEQEEAPKKEWKSIYDPEPDENEHFTLGEPDDELRFEDDDDFSFPEEDSIPGFLKDDDGIEPPIPGDISDHGEDGLVDSISDKEWDDFAKGPVIGKTMPDAETLKKDFAEAGSQTRLAEKYGVARGTIQRWLDKSGLPRRVEDLK